MLSMGSSEVAMQGLLRLQVTQAAQHVGVCSIKSPKQSAHLGDGVAPTLKGLQSPPVHLANNCLNAQHLFDCCVRVGHAAASCAVHLFPVFSYHLHPFDAAQLWQ